MSDPVHLDRYLDGDDEAFAAIYSAYRRPIYVYLLSFLRTRELADEILQEVFFALAREAESLRGRPSLGPWLYRVARTRAIDLLRSESRRARALDARRADPWFRRRASTPAETDPGDLQALLARLPDAQRETVLLREIGGLTFREIGELTEVPENTAITRHRAAVDKLREAWNRAEGGRRT